MAAKYTVTIGIPVYNESATIADLIHALLNQKGNFILEKVLIVSDNSTDNTETIVEEISRKDIRVELISDKKRLGKCSRLNQLYQLNQSDILLTFDGDVYPASDDVIEKMLLPFTDPEIGITTANDIPVSAQNWQQATINAWYMLWYRVRKDFNNGDTIYNVHGDATALRDKVAKTIQYPATITADQDFLYLSVARMGYKLAFVKDAIVYFCTPLSLKEFFFQTSRFLEEKKGIYIRGKNEAKSIYAISPSLKLKAVLLSLIDNPLFTTLAIFSYIVLLLWGKRADPLNANGMWQQISSTKKSIVSMAK